MSLDVYLTIPGGDESSEVEPADRAIWVRIGGSTREITRRQWDEMFPGQEPVYSAAGGTKRVYTANITHNLAKMASEAGCYLPVWRPEEAGIKTAAEMVPHLTMGLNALRADPYRFKLLNPYNGWGTYESLVQFLSGYLEACRDYPQAEVSVWR